MGGAGPEQTSLATPKTTIGVQSGTDSGTLKPDFDSDLAALIQAWPDLAAGVRADILRLAGMTKEQG